MQQQQERIQRTKQKSFRAQQYMVPTLGSSTESWVGFNRVNGRVAEPQRGCR